MVGGHLSSGCIVLEVVIITKRRGVFWKDYNEVWEWILGFSPKALNSYKLIRYHEDITIQNFTFSSIFDSDFPEHIQNEIKRRQKQ